MKYFLSALACLALSLPVNAADATAAFPKYQSDNFNQVPFTLKDLGGGAFGLATSGNVGGFTASVSSTVTFSVGNAAATGDYVGTTTTPQAFASAVRSTASTGIIQSLVITDKTTTAAVAMELWVFSATFTAPTDNAAWAISDADALNCIGVIEIPAANWYATSNNKVCTVKGIGLPIKPAATSLYYALVARGTTPAWATGDVQITLGILQD